MGKLTQSQFYLNIETSIRETVRGMSGYTFISMDEAPAYNDVTFPTYDERMEAFYQSLPKWLRPYVLDVRPNRNEFLIKLKDNTTKWCKTYKTDKLMSEYYCYINKNTAWYNPTKYKKQYEEQYEKWVTKTRSILSLKKKGKTDE